MRVNNQLNSYRLKQEMADYNRRMHKLVEEQKKQIEKEQRNVMTALTKLMKRKNPPIGKHLERVGYNCGLLAQGLQFLPSYENEVTNEFVETIEDAAKLHGIGSFVLLKNECDRGEAGLEYLKKSTEEGLGVLEEICAGQTEGRFLSMAVRIVRCHHANWDGTGYPALKGKEIPLEARIAALANDFDKLIEEEGCPVEEAIRRINEKSGSVYEPDIVKVLNKIWRQMKTDL